MDDFLDILWFKIVCGAHHVVDFLDPVIALLDVLGPVAAIFIFALTTVCFTKLLSKVYTTKQYRILKIEFEYWFNLRREAMNVEDRGKGKILAGNIDQAQLNKAYYDYFFEGFMKNILTIYLPVLIMGAYVNEVYQPDGLLARFGRTYVLEFALGDGEPLVFGAVFCYVMAILMIYLCWYLIGRAMGRKTHPEE